jgi:hypothetical protein
MARRFTDQLILGHLPLAMEGLAAQWLDSLPESLITMMDHDLELWFRQLRLRFAADISEVLARADALRHSFADEDNLDVRQYMSEKVQLYSEAGETSEDSIVRRVHRDLDPELGRDVRLHACGNTIAGFQADVIN